jgi:hypothetical protein
VLLPGTSVRCRASSLPATVDTFDTVSREFSAFPIIAYVSWLHTTADPGEPAHVGSPAVHSVWLRIRPRFDGQLQIDPGPTSLRLAVYTGETVSNLVVCGELAALGGHDTLRIPVRSNILYHAVVDSPAAGGFYAAVAVDVATVFFEQPASSSPPVAGNPMALAVGLTRPAGEIERTIDRIEFWDDTPDNPGGAALLGTLTRPPWSLNVGVVPPGLRSCRANVTFAIPSGVTVTTAMRTAVRSDNDAFAAAQQLPGTRTAGVVTAYENTASNEPGEPAVAPVRSLWWRWRPEFGHRARFSTSRGRLTVFAGDTIEALVPVGDGVNTNRVVFTPAAGVTYAIALGGTGPEYSTAPRTLWWYEQDTLGFRLPPLPSVEPASTNPVLRATAGRTLVVALTNANAIEALTQLAIRTAAIDPPGGSGVEWIATNLIMRPGEPVTFEWTPDRPGLFELMAVATNMDGAPRNVAGPRLGIAPANDEFAAAALIPGEAAMTRIQVAFDRFATAELGEDLPAIDLDRTVWWHYTPRYSGTVRLVPVAQPGRSVLRLFAGSSLVDLNREEPMLPGVYRVERGRSYFLQGAGDGPELGWDVEFAPLGLDVAPTTAPTLGQALSLTAQPADAEVIWTRIEIVDRLVGTNGQVTTNVLGAFAQPPYRIEWVSARQGEHRLTARGSSASGAIYESVPIDLRVRPANDDVAGAAPLTVGPAGYWGGTGNFESGTRGPGEPIHSAFSLEGAPSLWFRWVASWNGRTVVAGRTEAEQPDGIAVYRGTDPGSLTWVAGATNGVPATFMAIEGESYLLAIEAVPGAARPVRIELGQPPPNDDIAAAFEIPSAYSYLPGTNRFATLEPDEWRDPVLAAQGRHGTIWWSWACPTTGSASFLSSLSGVETQVAVYEGPSISNRTVTVPPTFVLVTSGPISQRIGRTEFRARQGENYWFALMGLPGTALPAGPTVAQFIFRLRSAPTNDLFANRLTLTGTNITVTGDTSWAATEPEEPTGSTSARIVNTLWYTWTAPGTGTFRISGATEQTGFVLSATAYHGDVLNTLAPAPATNGANSVRYGDRLQIQVGSVYRPAEHMGGGAGAFTLNLEFLPVLPSPVVLDQSQPDFDGWVSLRPVLPAGRRLAQTFVPAVSGHLDTLFLHGLSSVHVPYPTLVAIVETGSERPSDTDPVLGQLIVPNLPGEMYLQFASQSVRLLANRRYAIRLETTAPSMSLANNYVFRAGWGDKYPRGTLWESTAGGPWQEMRSADHPTLPIDMAFAVYTRPSLAPLEWAEPATSGRVRLRFQSEPNRSYAIQYSSDLDTWRTANAILAGDGGIVEWIDSGPPVTDPAPAAQPMRFYRVGGGLVVSGSIDGK